MKNQEIEKSVTDLEDMMSEILHNYNESEIDVYLLSIKIVDLVSKNKLMTEFIIKQLISNHIDKRFLLLSKPIEFLRHILDLFLSHKSLKETLEENEKFFEKVSEDIAEILKSEGPLKTYEITEKLNKKYKKVN